MLEQLDDPLTAGLEMVRFELRMLAELGFGLDLESCAATGAEDDLGYVSPKSGRAVSRDRGRALAGPAAPPAGVPVGARSRRRWTISPTALR